MSESLARTPLFEEHVELGARMVPFAGFEMPVQYPDGVLAEYEIVRGQGAGLFDISHMGQIRITGPDALAFVQHVATNDAARLATGQVQYSALLNERGTFLDDITTYRLAEDAFYLCVNAANRARDAAHLSEQARRFDVQVRDESEATALLALQGMAAQRMLASLTDLNLDAIGYYRFAEGEVAGAPALVSRTGYTGEDGFELYLPAEDAVCVWRALLEAKARPCGLAVRDMLRTEMGYALYGHEISEEVTPVEAGLMWITKPDKGDFIGRDAVLARMKEGPKKVLIGLTLTGRGIAREGYPVLAGGRKIGQVTSGAASPRAGAVALAYVSPEYADADDLAVEIRGRAVPATRTRPPFVPPRVRKA